MHACLKCAVRGCLKNTGRKNYAKIAICEPSHNFVGLYLRNKHGSTIGQEGQHPLIGQRAANSRLLANQ